MLDSFLPVSLTDVFCADNLLEVFSIGAHVLLQPFVERRPLGALLYVGQVRLGLSGRDGVETREEVAAVVRVPYPSLASLYAVGLTLSLHVELHGHLVEGSHHGGGHVVAAGLVETTCQHLVAQTVEGTCEEVLVGGGIRALLVGFLLQPRQSVGQLVVVLLVHLSHVGPDVEVNHACIILDDARPVELQRCLGCLQGLTLVAKEIGEPCLQCLPQGGIVRLVFLDHLLAEGYHLHALLQFDVAYEEFAAEAAALVLSVPCLLSVFGEILDEEGQCGRTGILLVFMADAVERASLVELCVEALGIALLHEDGGSPVGVARLQQRSSKDVAHHQPVDIVGQQAGSGVPERDVLGMTAQHHVAAHEEQGVL